MSLLLKNSEISDVTTRRDEKSNANDIALSKNQFYKHKNQINKASTFGVELDTNSSSYFFLHVV